jgi:hypothetical protein
VNKQKKIIFYSILITFLCLFIFFIKPICFSGVSSFLNVITKKNIGSTIEFSNFKLKNKKIILKNVSINSLNKFRICAKKIEIAFSFKFFKPAINTDIYCTNPEVILYKNQNLTYDLNFAKNKLFSFNLKIDEGLISFVDEEKIIKQINFDYYNSSNNISKLDLFLVKEKANKVSIDISKVEDITTFSAHLEEAETSHINDIFQFFNYDLFIDVKGRSSGIVLLDIENSKITRFFTELDFKNFTFVNPYTSLKFDFDHLKVEGNYPNENKDECLILKKIKYDFLKKTKLRMNFEKLSIFTNRKSTFTNMNGSFVYNPNLGSKLFIQGKIENEKTFDFQINSKAYITSSFSNWLDLNFDFDNKESLISLNIKEVEDYYNLHVSFKNIQAHIFEAFHDLVHKIYYRMDNFKFSSGNINFCVDGRFNQDGFNKVFITDLQLNNFDFQKDKIKGFISKLEGKSSFDLSSNKFWKSFFSDVKIYEGFLKINNVKIDDLNAKIFTLDGVFQSSSLSCLVENNQTNAEIKGKIEEFNILLQSKGKLKNVDDSFSTVLSCKKKNSNYLFSGNLKISDGEEAVFGFDVDSLYIFSLNELKSNLSKGWIRAEKIYLDKWSKILEIDTKMSGKANFAAFYRKNRLHLQLKGEDLNYKNAYLDLKIFKIGNLNNYVYEGDNYINIYQDEGVLSCDMPTFEGTCYLPKFDLLFDLKKAKVVVDNNILKANLNSISNNVNINGLVTFDFSKKDPLLSINIDNYNSDISSLQKLLKHFGYNNELNVIGKVKGTSQIITSFEQTISSKYFINFDFKESEYKINNKAIIQNISAEANYTSDDVLTFFNLKGDLKLDKNKYLVTCPVFNKTKDQLDIDLRIEKDIYDLFRIKGNLVHNEKKYQFFLDNESTHFFGEKINNFLLSFDENWKIDNFNMSSQINSYAFISQMQFLIDFGFFPIENIDLLSIFKNRHLGVLDLNLSLNENKNIAFEILSKNLEVFDKKIKDFLVKGTKSEKQIAINKITFDDFDSSLLIDVEPNDLKIKDCIINKKDCLFLNVNGCYSLSTSTLNTNISGIKIDLKKIKPFLSKYIKITQKEMEGCLTGKGVFIFNFPIKTNKLKFSFDLDFEPSNLTIEKVRLYNSGVLNINFSSNKGFLIQGLDFSFYTKDIDLSYLTCKVGGILYDFEKSRWLLKDTNLFVPASLKSSFEKIESLRPLLQIFKLDDDIDLTCDVELFSDLSNIFVHSKETSFTLNSKKHFFKDICFNINEKKCFLQFDYLHNNCYYEVQNDFELGKIIKAKTSFFEKTSNLSYQPLCIKWLLDEDKKIQVKEIIGHFSGADFLLQEDIDNVNCNKLFGSIKIDISLLKKIFPKSVQDSLNHYFFGKGYELSGRLDLNYLKKRNPIFEGVFSGKDFEMLGYRFKTLFSKISIGFDQIQLNDFKISDQAGILTFKELNLKKNENKWLLSIPFLKVKDLRPSLMQKINAPLQEITPFLIRELFLNDFKGNLGFSDTFSGHGHLYFINSFKRGHSVFDFPSDVLSRIVGIDQALLTPVKGKVQLQVKDAKFYLTNLKDSFSESERSKFFLLDKGIKPYIDFDGNIYINIGMKQYVLFKFTESFVISIRGNLENPQCNLKKKRGFLN